MGYCRGCDGNICEYCVAEPTFKEFIESLPEHLKGDYILRGYLKRAWDHEISDV